jgi:hypothetical protein
MNDIDDLDQQIKAWYTSIPKETQMEMADWESAPQYLNPPVHVQKEYDIQRLQIWTYLRLNQIRMTLHLPVLHQHSSIIENLHAAKRVVKLAKNTIMYLTHVHHSTNLYRKFQVFYHQFLASAITVLFLASCHAPVNFSSYCRKEFYLALELIKDLSSKSYISKRLWSTIKSLREVAPRLGLDKEPNHNAHAAPVMRIPSGVGQVPLPPHLARQQQQPPVPGSPTPLEVNNGLQMATEMSRFFEGYVNMHGVNYPPSPNTAPRAPVAGEEAGAPYFANGSVYQHFKEMF